MVKLRLHVCLLVVLKPGFHSSGKSQTVLDFTVSRPSQICRLMKTRNLRHPQSSGMNRYKSGESGRFYFPDVSQISAMVGDHSRQMKTQICTVGDIGVRWRWISLSTNPLNCWAPVPLSHRNMASLKNLGQTSGENLIYRQNLG